MADIVQLKALTLQFLRKRYLPAFHFWVNVLAHDALLKMLLGFVWFYVDWIFFNTIILGVKKLN